MVPEAVFKNKLGAHIASSNRTGYGDLLDAGIPVVVAVDQDDMEEVHRRSPGSLYVFRTKRGALGQDNPSQNIYGVPTNQIASIAHAYMDALLPHFPVGGFDVLQYSNEQDTTTIDQSNRLVAFHHACLDWCEAHGFIGGVLSFSTGNPPDIGKPGDANYLSMEQLYEPLLSVVERVNDHGHYLVLHCHGDNLSATGRDIALRHERALDYFATNSLHPNVIIGELSNGTGGVQPNMTDYLRNIEWWNDTVSKSAYSSQVVGGALYGFNQGESLTSVASQLAAYIKNYNPGPIIPPNPDPQPQPQPQPNPELDTAITQAQAVLSYLQGLKHG